MNKPAPCYCNAYRFPHRTGAGKCHRDAYNRIDVRANVASTLCAYDGWRSDEILAAQVAARRRVVERLTSK